MKHTVTSTDLGIVIEKKERPLFQWFLASYLYGKRIQHDVAYQTWQVFMKHGIDTPKKIASQSWQQLTELLNEGHFRRHNESIARSLHDMSKELVRDYHGNLLNMYNACCDGKDFTKRLQRLKGVGPNATEMFMREAAPVLIHNDRGGYHDKP